MAVRTRLGRTRVLEVSSGDADELSGPLDTSLARRRFKDVELASEALDLEAVQFGRNHSSDDPREGVFFERGEISVGNGGRGTGSDEPS